MDDDRRPSTPNLPSAPERPSTPDRRIPRAITTLLEEDEFYESESEQDNSQDPDYEESSVARRKQRRPAKSHGTPFKRRKTYSSLLTTQRRNVDDAVKELESNSTRPYCVVTQASADMTILEYAYVVGAATPDVVLDKLEWVWNKVYCSFNVDTRKNIHPLDVAIHRYFDRTDGNRHNGWFWCPTDPQPILAMRRAYLGDILLQPKFNPNMRRDPDEFYGSTKVFKYRLIPFPEMKGTWSVRRPNHFTTEFTSEIQVQQFYYPFGDLPVISLHVPYHFVVYDTGKKLASFYGGTEPTQVQLGNDFKIHPDSIEAIILLAIWQIYHAWMSVEPSSQWKSAPSQPGAGGPDSQDDSGGPYSPGGSKGGDGQGLPDENNGSPQGGSGPKEGNTDAGGYGPTQLLPSLGPEDSASCRDVGEVEEESDGQVPVDADEDEEWEDPEYGAWLEAWAEDVWKATQEDGPAHSPGHRTLSSSHSQVTLVGRPAASKDTPSMETAESLGLRLC